MGADEKNEKAEETRKRKEKITQDKEEKEEACPRMSKAGDGTGGILHEAGKIFGFDGLLKKLEKLPNFKKRLKEVDEEIEQRLKKSPSKMMHGGLSSVNSIPPGIKGTPLTGKRPGVKRPAASEVSTDVFDENDHLLVVADLPGVPEDTIDISLDGDVLTLSFIREGSGIKKGVKLPCAPEGEISSIYKNGILEVKIKKNKT